MAAALGAEARLLRGPSRAWAVTGGLAWGLGLWVSLYEPGVLLPLSLVLGMALGGRGFFNRERAVWAGVFVAVLAVALGVEGWHSPVPGEEIRAYFPRWSQTVGELSRVPLLKMVIWTGWLLIAAPVLLIRVGWKLRDRVAWFWLAELVALAALTAWQARWGYFLALAFAMALSWILQGFSLRWVVWPVFAISLWPVAKEWDRQFDPPQVTQRAERRQDNLALYDIAQRLRSPRRIPILAPWWQSPALAYWSGQPCVAGSSHESLPGTVDASRFFLSTDPAGAEAILARRRVACVVAYDADRVLSVSSAILGRPAEPGAMAELLYLRPHSAPPFLKPVYANAAFRVFLRPGGVE
jgi:hypothetical protein